MIDKWQEAPRLATEPPSFPFSLQRADACGRVRPVFRYLSFAYVAPCVLLSLLIGLPAALWGSGRLAVIVGPGYWPLAFWIGVCIFTAGAVLATTAGVIWHEVKICSSGCITASFGGLVFRRALIATSNDVEIVVHPVDFPRSMKSFALATDRSMRRGYGAFLCFPQAAMIVCARRCRDEVDECVRDIAETLNVRVRYSEEVCVVGLLE